MERWYSILVVAFLAVLLVSSLLPATASSSNRPDTLSAGPAPSPRAALPAADHVVIGPMATALTPGFDNWSALTLPLLSVTAGDMVLVWGQNDWTEGTTGPTSIVDSAGGTYVRDVYQQNVGGPGWGSMFVYQRSSPVASGTSGLAVTVNWPVGTNAVAAAIVISNYVGMGEIGTVATGATSSGSTALAAQVTATNSTAAVLMMAASSTMSTNVSFGPGQHSTPQSPWTASLDGNEATVAFTTQSSAPGTVTSIFRATPTQYDSSSSATTIVVYSPAELFPVWFNETGLPSSTPWSVTLGGTTENSTGSTIRFLELNGTYTDSISGVAGWTTRPFSGVVPVNGSGVAVAVEWTRVSYPVVFAEAGLPAGTPWFVNVTGGSSFESTNATVAFTEPNGSYAFTVATGVTYVSAVPNGTFVVQAARVSTSIQFEETFGVTFDRPSGTPVGATWTVYLNLTVTSAGGGVPYPASTQSIVRSSTASTLVIRAPNGSYVYSIVVPNNPGLTSSGTVSVSGAPVVANAPSNPSTFLGFAGLTGYYILIAVVVIAVVAVVLVIVLRRRRPPSPPLATAWENSPPKT